MNIEKFFIKKIKQNLLRRQISYVNWRYHKAELVERLKCITSRLNEEYYLISVYDQQGIKKTRVEGNDSIAVKFFFQSTGIEYHEENSVTIDHENGAVLIFSHSDVGFDTVFLYPANSKQSGAEHKTLILYSDNLGKRLSDKKLENLVRSLCLYHMYTSVLFDKSLLLRLKIAALRLKSFYFSYANPETKFKYSSGIYIPLASFVVSVVALVVAILALKLPNS